MDIGFILALISILYVLYDSFIVPKMELRKQDKYWEKIIEEYNKTAIIKATFK